MFGFKKKNIYEWLNKDFGIFYTYKKSFLKTKSRYQKIKVINTNVFGRALLLDNIIQVGEKNEYLYHELMAHPSMLAHKDPRDVLVIGAGDGGILKEVLKHPAVQNLTHVDIDEKVREVSQQYLPNVSDGALNDKRINFIEQDGRHFVATHPKKYDIIIMDMVDPIGQAISLYTYEYFTAVQKAFKNDDAFYVMHVESPISRPFVYASIVKTLQQVFKHTVIFYNYITMYGTLWAVAVCSNKIALNSISEKTIVDNLKQRRITNLQLINEKTFHSLQVPLPYIENLHQKYKDAPIIRDGCSFPEYS